MRITSIFFLALPLLAQSGGGVKITDTSGSGQTNRPFSISRVFKQGDYPSGSYPQASIAGTPTTTQVDVKNRWPDNSIKHAMVSFIASIGASATITVDFISQNDPHNTGFADKTALLTYNLTAAINTSLGNTAAATIINAWNGTDTGIDGTGVRYWLKGSICTQVIAEDRSSTRAFDFGSDANKSLHPLFILTIYPTTSLGVQVDYILENVWYTLLQDQTYDLTITAGGSTKYTKSAYLHRARSRWHKQFWSGTAPTGWTAEDSLGINVDYNRAYLITTGVLPNFDATKIPSGANITSEISTFNGTTGGDLDGHGEYTQNFTTSGGRPELGLVTQWEAVYLATMDAGMYRVMLQHGEVSGYVTSVHLRETSGTHIGQPVNIDDHADGTPAPINVGTVSASPWVVDTQHPSDFGFVPYLITGNYYWLEEMQMWASNTIRGGDPGNCSYCRNGAMGILTQPFQERGMAWGLEQIAHAHFFTPDASTQSAYWLVKLNNTLGAYEGKLGITDGAFYNTSAWTFGHDTIAPNGSVGTKYGRLPDPLGFIMYNSNCAASQGYDMNVATVGACTSGFMQGYELASFGYLHVMGYSSQYLLREAVKEDIELILNPTSPNPYAVGGFNFPRARLAGSGAAWFQTWTEYFGGWASSIVAKNSFALVAPSSSDSNTDNGYSHLHRSGLSFAASLGYSSISGTAQQAFDWMTNHMNTAVLSANPKWAIVPSQFVATVAVPNISPLPGVYSGTQTITFSPVTPKSIICYRLDGIAPTAPTAGSCGAGSTMYTTGISITNDAVIIYLATLSGSVNSSVTSAVYDIGPLPQTNGLVYSKVTISPGTSAASFVTDTNIYDYTNNAPTLPGVGNQFTDPYFHKTITQVTDINTRHCQHSYSMYPIITADDRHLVYNCDGTGTRIADIDPTTGRTSNERPMSGFSVNWEDIHSSPIDPDIYYGRESWGAHVYQYRVSTNTTTLLKDLSSVMPSNDSSLRQMTVDHQADIFAWHIRLHVPSSTCYADMGYLVWKRSTDTVLYNVTLGTPTALNCKDFINEVHVTHDGNYLQIMDVTDGLGGTANGQRILNINNGTYQWLSYGNPDHGSGHGSVTGHGVVGSITGAGSNTVGYRDFAGTPLNAYTTLVVLNSTNYWQDFHVSSSASEVDNWSLVTPYGWCTDWSVTPYVCPQGLYFNEVTMVNRVTHQMRRLAHHRSLLAYYIPARGGTLTGDQAYWHQPHGNISRSGKFAVFTSDWGGLTGFTTHRTAVFLIKVE